MAMTTFLETHWRLSVASILLVGVFIWVAVIFYSPPSPADSHSLSTLQKYVAVFKEVAAGHLTVVHVMADGQTDMARFNGAVLEVGEVRQRDIEWKQFQSVVADAGLASLQSQYQSPGDPSLVYEDVFYTLMSRDQNEFHVVTLHEASLPANFRQAVELLIGLADTDQLTMADGWFLQASAMRIGPIINSGGSLTNRGYDLTRIRDALPRFALDALLNEVPELREAVWYLDRYVPIKEKRAMDLVTRMQGNQKFYLHQESQLYFIRIIDSSRQR